MKFWEISEICFNFANFWARKMFFFLKQVRIPAEFDWYHYWGPSLALLGIVRHKTKRNLSVISEPSVPFPDKINSHLGRLKVDIFFSFWTLSLTREGNYYLSFMPDYAQKCRTRSLIMVPTKFWRNSDLF